MEKEINIAFFGDSICFGQGISIHRGWVPRIAQKLEELSKTIYAEIAVLNSSVNGNTTRMALERMPYDIQSHNINILLIQFGMNDCNHWKTDNGLPRVGQQAFEANLKEIIERAYASGVKKILINTNHPTTRNYSMPPSNITYQDSNSIYSNIIRKVARSTDGVTLIDIEEKLKAMISKSYIVLEDILLPDQLHLSAKGHDIYFEAVYPILEYEIKKLHDNEL